MPYNAKNLTKNRTKMNKPKGLNDGFMDEFVKFLKKK